MTKLRNFELEESSVVTWVWISAIAGTGDWLPGPVGLSGARWLCVRGSGYWPPGHWSVASSPPRGFSAPSPPQRLRCCDFSHRQGLAPGQPAETNKKVRVSTFATVANSVWLYLVPNVILYGWLKVDDVLGDRIFELNRDASRNVTRWYVIGINCLSI